MSLIDGISEAETPGSWLRRKRHGAGYETDAALARGLGVNQTKIFSWSHGVRPTAGHIRKLARLLQVKLPEAVKVFWNESFEGACACGLKGKKIFPDDSQAKRLWVIHPCESCGARGSERTYKKPSAKHRRLCRVAQIRLGPGTLGPDPGLARRGLKRDIQRPAHWREIRSSKVLGALWENGINRPTWRYIVET